MKGVIVRDGSLLLRVCGILCFSLFAMLAAGTAQAGEPGLSLLPAPKNVQVQEGSLVLPAGGRIVATDPKLMPLADVLAEEIWRLGGRRPATASDEARAGDIVLQFDGTLKDEQHAVSVGDKAVARGGTYRGVAWATVTIVQALKVEGDKLSLPRMTVQDEPDIKFRSAECDIARKWHPIANLYELVDLFRFYKISHIQFHMNDHGLFTFGSRKFPKLATVVKGQNHHYTIEELKALVAYADARGVTIIPEIEMPGHSDAAKLMPEIFGKLDAKTGKYVSSGYINVNRDDTVKACGELLEEAMDVFASSELISIGADEVSDGSFNGMPEYADFQKNHPGEAPYMHFVTAMNEVAKKRGKALMIYGRGGPKDVVQMPWTGNDGPLAKQGYKIVPYIAGSVTHHMPTLKKPPYNTIMLYSSFKTAYSFDFTKDRKIAPADLGNIYGIHILTWQHWHFMHLYDLRKTMASVSENAWNYKTKDSFQPFEQWRDKVWANTNRRLDDLVFPVKVETEGLLSDQDWTFSQAMQVKLGSPRGGTIRYRQEPLDFWRPPALPTAQSPAYAGPITITEPTVIYAALFDDAGKQIGHGTEVRYWPVEPKVLCTVYSRSALKEGVDPEAIKDDPFPNPDNYVPVGTVPLGWLTHTPSYRGMFMNGYFTTQEGRIKIPADGEYQFIPRGPAVLYIDGELVAGAEVKAKAKGKGKPAKAAKTIDAPGVVELKAGLHKFLVISQPNNTEKVMDYTGPGDRKPRSLDELMVLLPQFENSVKAVAAGLIPPGETGILSDSLAAPAEFGFATQLKVTLESPAAGGRIRYTLDGSVPTATSKAYDGPIVLTDGAIVMARRFDAQDKPVGHIWRQRYERRPLVVKAQGTVGPQDTRFGRSAKVTIVPAGNQAGAVRYTVDGSEPTAASPTYSGPIAIDKSTKIKARLFDDLGKPAGSTWSGSFKQVDFDPTNITFNKPVTSSGGENDGFYPQLANDGVLDSTQFWGAQPAPKWWQVDLGKTCSLNEIHLYTWWGGEVGDGRYYQYKVALSMDGNTWTDVVDASTNTTPASKDGYRHKFPAAEARHIRVTMLKNSANPAVHLVEVRAFEAK